MAETTRDGGSSGSKGLLDLIEWVGNKLPDPATLFLLGALLVMGLSFIASKGEWTVMKSLPRPVLIETRGEDGSVHHVPVIDEATGEPKVEWVETGETLKARDLLSRDGLYWTLSNMVKNFMAFPPLGVVLVGMLGIGIAERTGLLAATLKSVMLVVPERLFTPTMVFVGVMSSMTIDAGYVVLPPLAAALYKSVGRSPLAGIAAVFAGVSAGFNANLLITGLDPMLANFSTVGAQVVDENYKVNAACNWWFMIASTVVITFTGWAVTAWFVERRLNRKSPEDGGPVTPSPEELAEQQLKPQEVRGLRTGAIGFALALGILLAMIVIPGMPLYTHKMPDPANPKNDVVAEVFVPASPDQAPPANAHVEGDLILVPSADHFDRWVNSIVPMIFLCFITGAIFYGARVGKLRNDKDVAKLLVDSIAYMAPIIVLAFFAAQFTELFKYSGLDRMLALAGGQALGKAGLSPYTLMVAFILVTATFNLFVGSMSAKYAMFAPIFVPMFMMVGISPELTQAAYRIGDSVSNIITPLNAYLIIILVFMQKYVPRSGMGTLISMMMPYTIVFTIIWTILLLVWMALGLPLGVDGGLTYTPPL